MKIKAKVSIPLVAVNVAGAALFAYLSYASHRDLIAGAKQRELTTVATLIQNDIQEQSNKAAARASLICDLAEVKEAFRGQNRDLLATRLVPAMLVQRDKYGVREGQFHLPPAVSFLRIFDLKNFGEDLSSFREMVLTTNRRQAPQKGVEVGRRGLSIRGIDLVKDEQGAIGSFEIGISFSTVMENVKRNTGFEAGTFVDDALMTKIATEIPRPDRERVIGGYQAVESTNWQVVRSMVTSDLLSRVNDIGYRIELRDGIEYGVALVPLLDFKGTQIGCIVAAGSFEALQRQLKAALVSIVFTSVLLAVFLSGATLVVVNLVVVRPLRAVRESVECVAQGKALSGIDPGAGTAEEFRSIQQGLGKIEQTIHAGRRAKDAEGTEVARHG